jgi:hypothetical protein
VDEVPRVTGVGRKHLLSRNRAQLSHLNFLVKQDKYFLGSWRILAVTDKSVFANRVSGKDRG